MSKLEESKTRHQEAAYPKWIAYLDAIQRSQAAQENYSEEDVEIAVLCKEYATRVFTRSNVYLNFREKFVALKVDTPQRGDMITPDFTAFESRMAALGAVLVKTHKNRIYRILQR